METFVQRIAASLGIRRVDARQVCLHYSFYAGLQFDIDGPADPSILDAILADLDENILAEILSTSVRTPAINFPIIVDDTECAICLTVRPQKYVLPCRHRFCCPCIDAWLSGLHVTCPMCRARCT